PRLAPDRMGNRAHWALLGYGVIGNTSDSGSFVLGSSPGIPALGKAKTLAFIALMGMCEN
ncbi:MAG: hypothetical protein RL523_347, partial [Actinomycetota bacterium]